MKNITKNTLASILTLVFAVCTVMFILPFVKTNAKTVYSRVECENKVELYQLAPENQSLMQSYVIKTENDKLIVIDGGIDGYGTDKAPYLPSALRAILGLDEGEYFEVEAWFISHAHSDHYYELVKMLDNYKATGDNNYKINNFYFDFLDDYSGYIANEDFSQTTFDKLKTGLDTYATANSITVTGESYYDDLNGAVINSEAVANGLNITIDGIKFEILRTYTGTEGNVNDTSIVFRAWVDGQSILFLNDAGVSTGDELVKKYGSALKSDIVQMAHHGQNGVNKNAYDAIDANVRLWATPKWVWDNASGGYQIDTVLGWVGATKEANKTEIVAGLYDAYPTDPTKVADWKACVSGMKINLPYVHAYDNQFVADEGAGIRLTEGSTGLRFSATLYSYDPQALYGFVIVPKLYLTNNNITEDYIPQLITQYGEEGIIKMYSRVVEEGKHFKIYGSISNIKYTNINLDFVGIPFEYKDSTYTYATFNNSSIANNSRSVPQVASSVLNAYYGGEMDNDTENKTLIANNLSVINGFINKSINKANGVEEANGETPVEVTLSFAKTDYTGNYGSTLNVVATSNFANAKISYSSNNPLINVTSEGVVTSSAITSGVITACCLDKTATANVSFTMEKGYIATFDNESYENLVGDFLSDSNLAYNPSLNYAKSITAEYLESYQGETNVLKVTTTSNDTANQYANFKITLPKSCNQLLKVKYLVESRVSAGYKFKSGDVTFGNIGAVGSWQETELDYSQEGINNNELGFVLWAGEGTNVFYFSCITESKSIAKVKSEIKTALRGTDYLADFSSSDYEYFVANYDAQSRGEAGRSASVTAEYLDSFAGETNVMKITAVVNSEGIQSGSFKINLPISATGTVKIRFYIEANVSAGHQIWSNGIELADIDTNSINVWQEVTLDYTTSGVNKDELGFFLWSGTGTNVYYISWIKQEKTVEEIKTELASKLTGNYLATFDDTGYLSLVETYAPSGCSAGTIATEIVENFNGEAKVIKITATPSSVQWWYSGFRITLPKSVTNAVKIKFWLDEVSEEACKFWSNGTTIKSIKNTSIGCWQEVLLDYSISGVSKDYLDVVMWNNSATTDVTVFYIAYIIEENTVAQIKTAINTALAGTSYIADFSNASYENLVDDYNPSANTNWYVFADLLKAEYLESFEGESGVLKVTTTYNKKGSQNYAPFKLMLPQAVTGKIKIKYYVESKPAGANFKSGSCGFGSIGVTGSWIEKELDFSQSGVNANELGLEMWAGTNANVIYFAWIKVVEDATALKTRLANNLASGYVADFSSEDYGELVSPYAGSGNTGSVTTEYLATYQGETNVLKISGTPATTQWWYSGFEIALPKATTAGVKVKIWVDTLKAAGHNLVYGGTTKSVGASASWQEIDLAYISGNGDYLRYDCWRNNADNMSGADVVVYISFVQELA